MPPCCEAALLGLLPTDPLPVTDRRGAQNLAMMMYDADKRAGTPNKRLELASEVKKLGSAAVKGKLESRAVWKLLQKLLPKERAAKLTKPPKGIFGFSTKW